ncbi:MAG: hypothetical protein V1709_00860 [Planctomycetota bacterium]
MTLFVFKPKDGESLIWCDHCMKWILVKNNEINWVYKIKIFKCPQCKIENPVDFSICEGCSRCRKYYFSKKQMKRLTVVKDSWVCDDCITAEEKAKRITRGQSEEFYEIPDEKEKVK